jgi:hypothetical protein
MFATVARSATRSSTTRHHSGLNVLALLVMSASARLERRGVEGGLGVGSRDGCADLRLLRGAGLLAALLLQILFSAKFGCCLGISSDGFGASLLGRIGIAPRTPTSDRLPDLRGLAYLDSRGEPVENASGDVAAARARRLDRAAPAPSRFRRRWC